MADDPGGYPFLKYPLKMHGGIMIKKMEIYFMDLTPEAQGRLLKEFETTAEEENWDVFPIAEIEREMED
jgi:hypothetical protein